MKLPILSRFHDFRKIFLSLLWNNFIWKWYLFNLKIVFWFFFMVIFNFSFNFNFLIFQLFKVSFFSDINALIFPRMSSILNHPSSAAISTNHSLPFGDNDDRVVYFSSCNLFCFSEKIFHRFQLIQIFRNFRNFIFRSCCGSVWICILSVFTKIFRNFLNWRNLFLLGYSFFLKGFHEF